MIKCLSPRESSILGLICKGLTPAKIALQLNLSVKTVATYRSRILEKTKALSNAELAFRLGHWSSENGFSPDQMEDAVKSYCIYLATIEAETKIKRYS